jgi:hypothetical protein
MDHNAYCDWSSDVCSSDLCVPEALVDHTVGMYETSPVAEVAVVGIFTIPEDVNVLLPTVKLTKPVGKVN